uniref:Uncharacterized protein n=1 Tax=Peronospora matthiolae TaxID=2874970 RepID=A0AAV1V9Q3_9STRA
MGACRGGGEGDWPSVGSGSGAAGGAVPLDLSLPS